MKKSKKPLKDSFKEFEFKTLEKLPEVHMAERIRLYRMIPEKLKNLIFDDFKLEEKQQTTFANVKQL